MPVSSWLVVNKAAMKMKHGRVKELLGLLARAVDANPRNQT
jgi:hypothetical protein